MSRVCNIRKSIVDNFFATAAVYMEHKQNMIAALIIKA